MPAHKGRTLVLTPDRIHVARTSGLTDTHLGRTWRVSVGTVRDARVGLTHRNHPTLPDTAPRDQPGPRSSVAIPRKQRREWR